MKIISSKDSKYIIIIRYVSNNYCYLHNYIIFSLIGSSGRTLQTCKSSEIILHLKWKQVAT